MNFLSAHFYHRIFGLLEQYPCFHNLAPPFVSVHETLQFTTADDCMYADGTLRKFPTTSTGDAMLCSLLVAPWKLSPYIHAPKRIELLPAPEEQGSFLNPTFWAGKRTSERHIYLVQARAFTSSQCSSPPNQFFFQGLFP
jgi:hypothetical protein